MRIFVLDDSLKFVWRIPRATNETTSCEVEITHIEECDVISAELMHASYLA